MDANTPAEKALPGLLATQMMAAEVYSTFLSMSSDSEAFLWRSMLADEMEHIDEVSGAMDLGDQLRFPMPTVNLRKMRQARDRVLSTNHDQFLLRLEGALRMECAELDYGLEGVLARKLERNVFDITYADDVVNHISRLLEEAKRYAESPNIGSQIVRLTELFETALSVTRIITAAGEDE